MSGPNSSNGGAEFVAMPFTPKASAHVREVRVAIRYLEVGADQVNLSLYSDASGIPGTLLAGPVTVTNLPAGYPVCCTLAVAHFAPSLAITAGIQYWVVADTPSSGTGSDFEGGWAWVPPSKILVGTNTGGVWTSSPATKDEPPARSMGPSHSSDVDLPPPP